MWTHNSTQVHGSVARSGIKPRTPFIFPKPVIQACPYSKMGVSGFYLKQSDLTTTLRQVIRLNVAI